MRPLPRPAALLAVAAAAVAVCFVLQAQGDGAAADTARGTEQAFGEGLYPREMPAGQPPMRWTGPRARFTFHDVTAGRARVEVALRGHRTPVAVVVDGAVAGILPPGTGSFSATVGAGRSPRRVVYLVTDGFRPPDGRHLGTMVDRVALKPDERAGPTLRTLLIFVIPALALTAAAMAASLATQGAVILGLLALGLQAALLRPGGLVHSGYAPWLAAHLVLGAGLALLVARWWERRQGGGGAAAFVAVAAAVLVQGVAATYAAMVVSDALFHANKLAAVAAGDLFPTSVTQHAQPFRFPYGVSFYALLAPLRRAGHDPLLLVRWGAALSGVLASIAGFVALARRDAPRAAAAVVLLQLLPITFDVYSYGNLSNVFAQSVTVMFFAWWTGTARGGWPVGALLFTVAALGHFSSLVVLVVLTLALVVAERASLRADRPRRLALLLGVGLAAIYYAQFLPLVLAQAPRLLEGGGQGRGPSPGVAATLVAQLRRAVAELGIPALLLAGAAVRFRGPRADDRIGRALSAFWVAGGLLFLVALVSPLDVRWVYALGLPVAAAAMAGAARLWPHPAGRALAILLLGAQLVVGVRAIAAGLFERYR